MPADQKQRPGFFLKLFGLGEKAADAPHAAPSPDAHVTPDRTRCVQCGVCGYNCPVGIPVRDYARLGRIVDDVRCVQCGQCIEVCPRGTLRWSRVDSALSQDEAEYAALMQLFPQMDEKEA
jgi:ferredoxin